MWRCMYTTEKHEGVQKDGIGQYRVRMGKDGIGQ